MENVNYISQFLGRRVEVSFVGDNEKLVGVMCFNPYPEYHDEYAIQTDNGTKIGFRTDSISDIVAFADFANEARPVNDDTTSDARTCRLNQKNEIEYGRNDDLVNHPSHYTEGQFEVIDVIKDKLTPEQFEGYCIGNVMKYIMRYQKKNGLEDLKKGLWYLNHIIKIKEAEAEKCKKQ